MKIRKTEAKNMQKYHFSGIIKDAYEYTSREGADILVLVCRDKQDASREKPDRDLLFSNYKSKFEELSAGIDNVEPGSNVEIDYVLYKNEVNGKTYFNFIDVKFPLTYPTQAQLDKYWEEWKKYNI